MADGNDTLNKCLTAWSRRYAAGRVTRQRHESSMQSPEELRA
jgi:hypothetical protein